MRRSLLAAALCLSYVSFADLTLVNDVVSGGKTRLVTLSAKGSKAYFEMKEADGPTRTMVRDGEAKKLFVIDHQKKIAMVITEQDSKAQEAKNAALKAQLAAQLAKMPPEQRARAESTMLGQLDAKPAVFTYEKKKTPPRKIAGFSCQDYSIKRDGQAGGEGCFATWKDIGIPSDEFRAIMVKALATTPNGPMAQAFDAADAAPGFPVWRQHVNAQGEVTTETTLKSISKTAVAAENFEVPKGYTEKTMGEAMRPPAPPPPPAPAK